MTPQTIPAVEPLGATTRPAAAPRRVGVASARSAAARRELARLHRLLRSALPRAMPPDYYLG